jgi:hypothetical protein
MVYTILLTVGGLGLVVQAVLGFAHGDDGHGHDGGHHHDTSSGHEAHAMWALLSPPG